MANPESHKRIIRALIETVWIGGRLDDLPLFWTADCVNHAAASADKVGLAAMRRYHKGFGAFFASFANVTINIVQQIGEADRVVTQVVARMEQVAPFMGIPARGQHAELATIRIDRIAQGKIAEHWSVADMAGFMAQLSAA